MAGTEQRPALGAIDGTPVTLTQETAREYKGISQALNEGNRLHGFRSGGGLRVVRIERDDELVGYGEHPSADEALVHADEDFLAGGRDYHEVYGKLYPHYLTGSSEITSPLDGWLIQGHTFDAYRTEAGQVAFELKGLKNHDTPEGLTEQVKAEGNAVHWQDRGYTYETSPFRFPNGEEGVSTRVVEVPENKDEHRAFMYYISKTGEGSNFQEAMDKAFEASEVEVPDQA